MGYVVKDTRTGFTFDVPRADLHDAVCVDMYVREAKRGYRQGQEEVVLVWEVDQINPDFNAPYLVRKAYNPTLTDGSLLGTDLQSWRNKPFTDEERAGFDLEQVVGKRCTIEITHSEPYGRFKKVYADVNRVLPARKGAKFTGSGSYIRVEDRPDTGVQTSIQGNGFAVKPPFEVDDDLPF